MHEPTLRFKEFNDQWNKKKIGELAEIVRGASPRPIQDPKWFDNQSNIGWLRISDVTKQNGRIHYLEQKISKLGQEKTRVLNEPHLLLSIAATVGKPVINYVKTGVHDGFLIFLNPSFDQEFMFQWLEMFRPHWQKYGQPGSQVNLNSELVRNQEILMPSIEEQRKIAKFFEVFDKKIQLQKEKIDLLKEQKKGFMQKIFSQELRFNGLDSTWKSFKLSDLAIVSTGKAFSSLDFNDSGEYLVVTNKNIQDEINSVKSLGDRIDISDKTVLDNYLLKGNNILVTMDGVNIGKVGKFSNDKAVLAQRVGRINSEQFEFIYQVISSEDFVSEMNKLSVGNAIKHISLKQISDYSFLAPIDKEEQTKIGTFLNSLDKKIQLIQQQVKLLEEQKKAFLQQMFI